MEQKKYENICSFLIAILIVKLIYIYVRETNTGKDKGHNKNIQTKVKII